jgi:hypothetical protein
LQFNEEKGKLRIEIQKLLEDLKRAEATKSEVSPDIKE